MKERHPQPLMTDDCVMTEWKKEWKALAAILAGFMASFYLPVGSSRFDNAVLESLHLVKWYAQEHVLLCLIPAFFIQEQKRLK